MVRTKLVCCICNIYVKTYIVELWRRTLSASCGRLTEHEIDSIAMIMKVKWFYCSPFPLPNIVKNILAQDTVFYTEEMVQCLEELMEGCEIPQLKSSEEPMVYIPGAENHPNGHLHTHIYLNVRAFSLCDGNKSEKYNCKICPKEQTFICLTCTMMKPIAKFGCHPPESDCSRQHENQTALS